MLDLIHSEWPDEPAVVALAFCTLSKSLIMHASGFDWIFQLDRKCFCEMWRVLRLVIRSLDFGTFVKRDSCPIIFEKSTLDKS